MREFWSSAFRRHFHTAIVLVKFLWRLSCVFMKNLSEIASVQAAGKAKLIMAKTGELLTYKEYCRLMEES